MDGEGAMLRVTVRGFALDEVSKSPIVLLQPVGREEVMPIWIGPSEASSIALSLSGEQYDRPLTHDLLRLVLDGLAVQHQRTEIVRLENNTFFARVLLRQRNDYVSVDCRPSDGIAVALRTRAEIFVDKELFEAQKQIIRPREEGELEES
ncbi:MAG: bifunctional nuclease family protein [Candidatus Krumholzibacteriota bacterium]|nr:bifunctional nuclease family protein [Candidatus Krumholzibacteriota bacterium]